MKHCILFLLFFISAIASAQEIVSDTAYVQDTVINDVKYFQEVAITTFDNGASQTKVGPPRLDSATFVQRRFRDAHDAMLPVARGVELLANRPNYFRTHRYYSDMLERITGKSYKVGVIDGTYDNYITPDYGPAVWRVFYDSAGVTKNFFVYYNDSLNIGREITNAPNVVRGEAPSFVTPTNDRRIRFFPYETFFSRVTLLVRDGEN